MFYDKRTQRKIQLLNLLIALLILIPILLDFSKGFMMGLNSSFIALICMIIKLVQLIKSVASDGLMNRRNIKRLRLLSYFMITFYLVSYIDSFITTSYYRSHLSLGDNQICYPELSASVTIAFILLLLAEILNIAYKQREELDLTI